MAIKTYAGSCHCGAVRYEADLDLATGTFRCNCSYCGKARAWFAFAKGPAAYRLIAGKDELSEYRFKSDARPQPFLTYRFCKVCGVRAYGQGELEALGGLFHAVPVSTLDEVDADELAQAPVHYLDGRNNRFDAPPADVRTM